MNHHLFAMRMDDMSVITPQLQRSLTQVSPLLKIQDERDYDLALERLNSLIDEVGTDERHPLYSLVDTLGNVVHAWEEQHFAIAISVRRIDCCPRMGGTTPSHTQIRGSRFASIPHGGT